MNRKKLDIFHIVDADKFWQISVSLLAVIAMIGQYFAVTWSSFGIGGAGCAIIFFKIELFFFFFGGCRYILNKYMYICIFFFQSSRLFGWQILAAFILLDVRKSKGRPTTKSEPKHAQTV